MEDNEKPSGPGRETFRQTEYGAAKRPAPTIDLSASVVEEKPLTPEGAGETQAVAAAEAVEPSLETTAPSSEPEKAESATASPAPERPRPPERRASSGFGRFVSHAFSGALGAVLALFGAQYANMYAGDLFGTRGLGELSSRIGTLEAEVKEKVADTKDAALLEEVQALKPRVASIDALGSTVDGMKAGQQALADKAAALEKAVAALPSEVKPSPEVALRLARMEETLKSIADASKSEGGNVAGLAALVGKMNDFETQLETRLTALRKTLDDETKTRIATLDTRIAEGLTSGSSAEAVVATLKESTLRIGGDVETLKLGAERLDQKITAVQSGSEEVRREVEALKSEGGRLTGDIGTLKSDVDKRVGGLVTGERLSETLAPVTAKLDEVSTGMADVKAREAKRETSAQRILLVLELANLRRAIERGGSYAPELESVKRVAPPEIDLTALSASAEKGLPTLADLRSRFSDAAKAMLDADAPAVDDGTVFGRLVSGARSIVRVRQTGEVPGDSTEAVVARMESALARGDLESVEREASGLKDDNKAAGGPWLAELASRMSVDRLMRDTEGKLKDLLSETQAN